MKHALFAALTAMAIAAHAEPKSTYVGDGRFACRGSSTQCAQVDANNRQQQERQSNDYQRSQDHAQAVVDRERRKDEQRRNEQRRP